MSQPITFPKSLFLAVFLAALWFFMIPLSAWAVGKGLDATGDTGTKSDVTGKTKQPENSVKKESKSGDKSGRDGKTAAKEDRIGSLNSKEKEDTQVAIVRTLVATVEKDGSYRFGGKILADGGSTILGAGVELSSSLRFKNSIKIAFELKSGKSAYRAKTRKLEPGSTCFYRAYVRNSAGANVGSVKRLKVPESEGTGGWWSEGEKLGGGWRKTKWFGSFRKQEGMEWVYHEKLGWTYVVSDQRDGLWLWQKENGWTWTQKGVWPCLWRNKTGSWLCLMGSYQGKPVFYDYASRKVKNRTEKQDKTDKSKAMEVKTKSEKGQSSKEQNPKNGQASKEKQGEKVSEKTIDPGKSVDWKTTEAKAKVSAENKSEASATSSTGQNGKDAGQNENAKVSEAREPDSSRSNEKQAGNKEKEPDAKISDKKEAAPTDPRKNDAPARQSESSDSTTGNGQAGESKEKTLESTGSKEDDSSPPETTRSVDEAAEETAGDPTKTNTQKSSR